MATDHSNRITVGSTDPAVATCWELPEVDGGWQDVAAFCLQDSAVVHGIRGGTLCLTSLHHPQDSRILLAGGWQGGARVLPDDDSRLLLCRAGKVEIWDLRAQPPQRQPLALGAPDLTEAQPLRGGGLLTNDSQRGALLWDLGRDPPGPYPLAPALTSSREVDIFASDERTAIYSPDAGTLSFWDVGSLPPRHLGKMRGLRDVMSITFTLDGGHALVFDGCWEPWAALRVKRLSPLSPPRVDGSLST